jgi:hypothetical protein
VIFTGSFVSVYCVELVSDFEWEGDCDCEREGEGDGKGQNRMNFDPPYRLTSHIDPFVHRTKYPRPSASVKLDTAVPTGCVTNWPSAVS